ncbi:MAG: DUF4442 domain-containing protein [Bacteriovoracaceae bacterium]
MMMGSGLMNKLPVNLRNNLMVTLFGILKIPMIFFVRPKVLELSDSRCRLLVPFSWRNKNHLGVLYIGAMTVAADVTGGLAAMKEIINSKRNVHLLFKDMKADYYKRAEGDTVFTCNQAAQIKDFVQDVIKSGERKNFPLEIVATVPSKLGDEPVAKFILTLSLKLKE